MLLAPSGRPGDGPGGTLTGTVRAATADSVTLLLDRREPTPRATLAWDRIARVDRASQNRTGEAFGMLLGLVVGGLGGYVAGDALSDDPLAPVAAVPAGFVGLLVGGIVGARVGTGWTRLPVPAAGATFGLAVPIR